MNQLYHTHGALCIGYHGCDRSVAETLLLNPNQIHISQNNYDWLGSGFYVWDDNYLRALQWATDNKKINPDVVGVVYELGNCLDLMNANSISALKSTYEKFLEDIKFSGVDVPHNEDLKYDEYKNKILRYLDCSVINYLNDETDTKYKEEVKLNGYSKFKPREAIKFPA